MSGCWLKPQQYERLRSASILPSSSIWTRSSATAEKQHVSCACLPRLVLIVQCTKHHRITEDILLLTFERSDSRIAVRKRILSWNSHSRSFTVIHFAISYRSTRGSISVYNNYCLLYLWSFRRRSHLNRQKIAVVDNPLCGLTPRPRRTPASIPMHLIFPETRVSGLHFVAMGSKRRIFSATECILAVQGHSRSSKVNDFGTNRKRVCDFLLVINSNYGPILHRFRDTATSG